MKYCITEQHSKSVLQCHYDNVIYTYTYNPNAEYSMLDGVRFTHFPPSLYNVYIYRYLHDESDKAWCAIITRRRDHVLELFYWTNTQLYITTVAPTENGAIIKI